MEDDDEFGDLYTDVLRPLTTSFQTQPRQPPPGPPPSKEIPKVSTGSAMSYHGRPIDLNVTSDDEGGGGDDLFGAPNPGSGRNQTLAPPGLRSRTDPRNFDLNEEFGPESGNSEGFAGNGSDSKARVLGAMDWNSKLPENSRENSGFVDGDTEINVPVKEKDVKDDDFVVKDGNLADETKAIDKFSVGDGASGNGETGVLIPGVSTGVENGANPNFDDDWDSDSEDDLEIVLNDTHHGPMGMDRMGGEDDDEDDEDGDPLMIVADNDDPGHQPMMMDEQEWRGGDVGTGGDGEKELGEAGKLNGVGGAAAGAPKIGYRNHGYHHPYHSQFKYVRPGASAIPGAAPVGPGGPGQVRPPVGMGPIAGRGRGDWRPAGMKGSPGMQKGFHQGYGMPNWGAGASGRGLEFTLPSHKTIFEVDIDAFEEKPWRLQGVDMSDFFNFGLTEESWKDYCKQLEQLRIGTTMQSKIRIYESGRTEQGFDPDLPPELAAAAGVQETPSESTKPGKADAGQNDSARGTARVRPPLPTGRPIQVEAGYGERLPSIDTRKPRISDLDVIIEIVCQDSVDDDTNRRDDVAGQADIDPATEDHRDGDEFEEPQEASERFGHSPHSYYSRKREVVGRRVPLSNHVRNDVGEGDEILPFTSEAPSEYHTDSREQTPVCPERSFSGSREDRLPKGRVRSSSPVVINKERMIGKRSSDNKESLNESTDGKSSPLPSSPFSVGNSAERKAEPKDSVNDEIVRTETCSDIDKEEFTLNSTRKSESLTDVSENHASKKQKFSQVESPLPEEVDEQEDSKAASSENSKARSGSSNYRKLQDVEEEEVQGGRGTRTGHAKRSVGADEDIVREKVRGERQENERHCSSVKGREDFYQHKGRDSSAAHSSRVKSETINLRRDIDNKDGAHQRREEDIPGRRNRAEDSRKREHRDETVSRQRSRAREIERHEKDEHHQLRKQLDNGNWRVNYDKDSGYRHRERDDSLKSRNENVDDLYNTRKKEEALSMSKHTGQEESLHAHRENSSRRKRERDDVPEQRRRDDQVKTRDDVQHIARHKEDAVLQRERGDRQRERDEWYRIKQMNQEVLPKKDKEAAWVGMRSGRTVEEKTRGSQSRGKDDHRSSDKEFHPKDAGRSHELPSRRDRAENVSLSRHTGREDPYVLGNSDGRRARHERTINREDHAANASDNHKVHGSKHRENPRKEKEYEIVDRNSLSVSKKHQDETSVRLKGRVEHSSSENEAHVSNPSSRKPREEVSSDDLSESRRGRSKLERWTSHKERDFGISTKSSSSVKIKQIESHSSSGPSVGSKVNDEAAKKVEDKQQHSGSEKDVGSREISNSEKKPLEERHLDTVEKLKKRSERFKLPMPSEKEATTIKKMENEPLSYSQSENGADFEIKAERPARKRRWMGN